MPQTLFSVIALALGGLISFQQLGQERAAENRLVRSEMEVLASGVAVRVLEHASSLPFDERTTPAEIQRSGLPTSVNDYTQPNAFGEALPVNMRISWPSSGSTCPLGTIMPEVGYCNDLDDLHMADDEWQPVTVTRPSGATHTFEARVEVEYVRQYEGDITSTGRSEQKRLEVFVRAPQLGAQQNVQLANLSRVLSYRRDQALRQAGL